MYVPNLRDQVGYLLLEHNSNTKTWRLYISLDDMWKHRTSYHQDSTQSKAYQHDTSI